MRPESETPQPLLRIQRRSVLVNAEAQLGNAFTIGHDFADFFVGGDFLPRSHKYLLQAGIDRKIVSVIDDNRVPNGGHDSHSAHFAFEYRPYLLAFLGLNVDAFILKNNPLQHRVALASETQRHKTRNGIRSEE